MDAIKKDDSVLKATVLYPPTMAASAVRLGRLLGQSKSISELAEQEIPASRAGSASGRRRCANGSGPG
jgi:ribose transport system substrate-binding protein